MPDLCLQLAAVSRDAGAVSPNGMPWFRGKPRIGVLLQFTAVVLNNLKSLGMAF